MYAAVLSGPFLDTEYCFQVALENPNNDDCQLWAFIKPNKLKPAVYEIVNAGCRNNVMLKNVQGHPEKWLVGYSFPDGEDPCRNPVSDAHSWLLCYQYRSCIQVLWKVILLGNDRYCIHNTLHSDDHPQAVHREIPDGRVQRWILAASNTHSPQQWEIEQVRDNYMYAARLPNQRIALIITLIFYFLF